MVEDKLYFVFVSYWGNVTFEAFHNDPACIERPSTTKVESWSMQKIATEGIEPCKVCAKEFLQYNVVTTPSDVKPKPRFYLYYYSLPVVASIFYHSCSDCPEVLYYTKDVVVEESLFEEVVELGYRPCSGCCAYNIQTEPLLAG